MRARDAVITHPGTVPPLRRGVFAALTLLAWTAFGWLIAPAVTLLLWALGLFTAYREAVTRWGDVDPDLLIGIAVISTALCLVLVGWASLQRRRFTGVERRHRLDDVEPSVVARNVGVPPEVATAMRTGRVVSLSMDDDGHPVAARSSAPATPWVLPVQWFVPTQPSATPRLVPARPDGTDNAVPTGVVPGPRSRNRSVRDPAARP